MYPNPVVDELTLKLPENGTGTVVIYNSIGKEVYRNIVCTATAQLSLAALPSGNYHVILFQNNKRYAAHVLHR